MKTFLVVVVVILALMVMSFFVIREVMPVLHNARFPTTQGDWTLLADVFSAGVGTFFAGLAFAGLIWTIRLQQSELGEVVKAQNAQAEAQNAQVEIAQLAARLNAVTVLLGHYEGLIAQTVLDKGRVPTGRGELGRMYFQQKATLEEREQLLTIERDNALAEVMALKNRLTTVVEAGPTSGQGTSHATAKGEVVTPKG